MERRVFTVSELTLYLQARLEGDPVLQGMWVEGEISNFTHHSSGHMYFTLKDNEARIRCVMFRGQNSRLRFKPGDGMSVMAHGAITVYVRNGDYQLYVDVLEPSGLGSLFLAFEQLKQRLEREGLFDPGRKRPLPAMPGTVALITSPTGAAVRDMIKVLRRRRRDLHILIIPARVQGDDAPSSLVSAIQTLNSLPEVDVAIVGRGGGSIEELWAFNDEGVARAIAKSPVPVISAVGHETDFTVADFVADLRAPTPSAAAELATADGAQYCRALDSLSGRMAVALKRSLAQRRQNLERLTTAPGFSRIDRRLALRRQETDLLFDRLQRAMCTTVTHRRHQLGGLTGRLDALSPLATLSRGYSVCLAEDGRVIRRASQAGRGDRVSVLLSSGRLECRVEGSVEEDADGQKAGQPEENL